MRLVFVLLFFTYSLARGAETYKLSEREYSVTDPQIANSLEYFADSGSVLNEDKLSAVQWRKFDEYQSGAFDKNITYWFKINIHNGSTSHRMWFLELLDPNLKEVKFIYPEGLREQQQTGISKRFSSRDFAHKNFVLPIFLEYSKSTTVYFSVKNPLKSRIRLSLRPARNFLEYALSEYFFLGIFYGIMLIMIMYNLSLYYSTKESIYVYYVLYVLCFSFNSFRTDGLGFQFIWPNYPIVSQILEFASPLLLVISFAIYSEKFLTIGKYAKIYKLVLLSILIMYICLFSIDHFIYSLPAIDLLYGIAFGIISLGGILALRNGDRSAKYFLMALSFLTVGFTIFLLRKAHIISTSVFTVYALNFGFVMEVLIFSFGIGQKFRFAKEEQEILDKKLIMQLQENERLTVALNNELALRVLETSRELEAKHVQMEQMLEEIKSKSKQIGALNEMLGIDSMEETSDVNPELDQ